MVDSTSVHSGTLLEVRNGRPRVEGREWVTITNPTARSGNATKKLEQLRRSLKASLGGDVEYHVAERPSDTFELARAAAREGVGTVIAVGGDGTANGVATGLLAGSDERRVSYQAGSPPAPKTKMALIPAGTRNVLAKSLGIPEDMDQAIAHMSSHSGRALDALRSTPLSVNGGRVRGSMVHEQTADSRIILNAAEVGLAAEVSKRSKRIRGVLKNRAVSTAAGLVATVPVYTGRTCEIRLDGRRKRIVTKMAMCVVANGRMIGGGFEFAPLAIPNDGLLDVSVAKSGSMGVLKELIEVKAGEVFESEDFLYVRAKSATISPLEGDTVPVMDDGEPAGNLPVEFRVLPGAISFRY